MNRMRKFSAISFFLVSCLSVSVAQADTGKYLNSTAATHSQKQHQKENEQHAQKTSRLRLGAVLAPALKRAKDGTSSPISKENPAVAAVGLAALIGGDVLRIL